MRKMVTLLAFNFILHYVGAQNAIYQYDKGFVASSLEFPLQDARYNFHRQSGTRTDSGQWSREFTIPGISGPVFSTGSDGNNLFIGGNFKTAGSALANSIVKWDGQEWSSIGLGPENGVTQLTDSDVPSVEAIACANGNLYIGGQFLKAGTLTVNGIAFHDGSNWHELGTDSLDGVRRRMVLGEDTMMLGGFVYSLFEHNDKLYAGGYFNFAGETESNGVAVWDINTGEWESLNGGLANSGESSLVYAYSFAAKGDTIFVGGKFDSAGGVPAQNIAKWDGSQWHAMGEAEGYVYDLKFDSEGNLYAAGFFNADEGTSECGLGMWNGTEWISLQGPEGYNSSVRTLQIHNDDVYAGGSFVHPWDVPAALAKWDGSTWQIIPGLGQSYNEFFLGGVSGIEFVNGRMYVAGDFTQASDLFVVNAVEWDYVGSEWKKLDDGSPDKGIHDGEIRAMARKGDTIFAGGNFSVAGGVFARNIASWNGTEWGPLGTGFENGLGGSVYTLLADGDDLYAGGYFGSAGSSEAFHIAKWNGTEWSPIGIGVGGVPGAHVRALALQDDYLYVGGYFSVVGDSVNFALPANSIARFNLVSRLWESLGEGIEMAPGIPGKVYAMEVSEGKIYIGGEFLSADEMSFQNFVVLEDNKFTGIGDIMDVGIEGMVSTIKVINNEIYAGGTIRPGPEADYFGILKWDGQQWAELAEKLTAGSGVVFLRDIEPFLDGFLAGGQFTHAGELEADGIAYFDGNTWIGLGEGVLPGVLEIAVSGYDIYVAGPTIMYTGDDFGIGLTKFVYDDEINTGISDPQQSQGNFTLANYPNPFRELTTISWSMKSTGRVELSVFDLTGNEVRKLVNECKQPGSHCIDFDASGLADGVYFYRIFHGDASETKKMILVR